MPRTALLGLLLMLPACTTRVGHDFQPPDPASLIIGQTNEAQIVALEGVPTTRIVTTKHGHDAEPSDFDWAPLPGPTTTLRYETATRFGIFAGARKSAMFIFRDDRLAGWVMSGETDGAGRPLDVEAARSFLQPGLPQDALLARLGPPDGVFAYPLTARPGEYVLRWEQHGRSGGNQQNKVLRLLFDATGRLLVYRLAAEDTALPVPMVGAPVFVPMIVRTHR